MDKKKIFWLEDFPYIDSVMNVEELSGGKLKRLELLNNVAFAPDFKNGEKILKSSDFDLYILDGDFPDEMSPDIFLKYNKFVEMLKKKEDIKYPWWGHKNLHHSAFIPFYLTHLSEKNVVVHSMSENAKKLSFLLGLPFYQKSLGVTKPSFSNTEIFYHNDITSNVPESFFKPTYEFIKKNPRWNQCSDIKNFWELKKTPELLDGWEYGGPEELIKNYLVPLLS